MTTKTEISKIAKAITGVDVALSDTFVAQAGTITDTCSEVYGENEWNIPAKDMDAIVNQVADNSKWKGTSSEGARRSEVKAIVKAYPFLKTAVSVFKREFGECRRNHFLKVARECPKAETATDAGLLVAESLNAKKKPKNVTPADKLAAAFTTAVNTAREMKNDSLANSLRVLARKHGVKLK